MGVELPVPKSLVLILTHVRRHLQRPPELIIMDDEYMYTETKERFFLGNNRFCGSAWRRNSTDVLLLVIRFAMARRLGMCPWPPGSTCKNDTWG